MALSSEKVFHVESYLGGFDGQEDKLYRNAAILAAKNNYEFGDATKIVQELLSDAAYDITGIAAPGAAAVRILKNVGSSILTLKNQSASSSAANRFICPGGSDYALAAGGFVPIFYDYGGTSRWIVSTVVPRSAFKVAVENSDGSLILLNRHFWSVQHTGLAADGTTASTGNMYYAYGLTVPTASYAFNSAITRKSIPILSGVDEVLHQKRGEMAVFFKAAAAETVLLFRSNEGGQGFSR